MSAQPTAAADPAVVIDRLPVVVFRVGPDLRITYANRTGCDLVGLRPDQVLGRSCRDLGMGPDAYGRWVEHLQAAFRTGAAGHFEYLRPGPPADHLIEYRFVPESGPAGAVASVLVAAVVLDEVRQLRDALRCREELFREFMNNVPAIAWMRVEPGRYVFVNKTYLDHFGINPEDRIGKTFDEVWAPDVAARFRANDLRVLASGRAEQFIETVPDPDGTPRTWLDVKFPFTGPDGERYVGGVGVDVTERERAAAARRELDARLVSAQKVEGLALLAAGAAHDFKNILSVMLGNADLAAAALPPDSPARECLDAIVAAGERAAGLCRQMTSFAGATRPRPGPTDFVAVARDTVRMVYPVGRGRVEVLAAAAEDVPPVWADPSQLSQVVLNLVTNAVQAVGPRPGRVAVSVGAAGGRVTLEVADDGCGIPAADLPRVFDPFFTTKADGSGLGLAAVAGIVRDLGGTIGVESAAGVGTTFRVALPAHRTTPA